MLGQFERNGRGQVRPSRTGASPFDEVGESEFAEHLAVSGRGEIDRDLPGQLTQGGLTWLHRDRNPRRDVRRRPARGGGVLLDLFAYLRDPLR